jgi:hypothetical protein
MELQVSQSKKFRFRDERQKRNFKRLSLIGKGPAAFYKDACQLISEGPMYDSTVHIVAHLLREVESALRAVLLPYNFEQPEACNVCGSKKEVHKRQIEVILKTLGFGVDDDVSKLWLKLTDRGGDYGLARKAHRDALEPPRRVDATFYRLLADIDTMLDAVLEKFEERFLAAVPLIEEILRTPPSKKAVTRLQNEVPNNGILHGYFFQRLNDPTWLDPLNAKGFFDHPPEPIQDSERGTIIYPNWPESKYLERMAAIDSLRLKRTIVGIALKVVTDNPTVYLDLTKAVLQMPADMQVDWANKMAAWLGREVFVHPLLPEQLGNLASSLAEGGYTNTSIDLLRILLAVQQDPRESGEGSEAIWAPQPRPRFNLWHYAKVIRKNVPVLTKASPMDALSLLCDLLEEALELSWTGEKGDEGVQDYWRPSIDAGRNDRLLDALVSGVRDVAAQIAGNDPSQVPAIIESLETRPFRIFRRLSLHLLHSFPDTAPHLAAKRLTDRENFDNHGLRREYNELLKSCFARLDEAQQSWIMSWIEEGPQNVENFKESFESWYERPITESDIDEYVNKWKLERMDPFREALTDVWKETYERLASQYGRQVSDQGLPYMVSETTEYISPKSPEELGGMGLDDLVSYLESWNPSENAEGYSLLGLESALRTTILNIPEHFSNRAEEFKNLRPVFIRALISALTSALDQGRKIQWKPVLNLCTFIAAKPLSFPAGGDDKSNEHDRLFAQLKKESSSLIRKGIRADESRIPDALGQTVFELMRSLINGLPQINTEQLNNKNRSTAEAVIYARATALEDIIRCAYWVHEMRQANSGDTTVEAQASGYSGELRKILDRNLDLNIDPDLRLRKVYGESFPILVYLEHEWASRNVPTIFPLAEMERPLFEAAWQSYVLYSGYYAPAFEMLKEQYRVAIVRLGTAATVEVYGVDPDRQLAQHIMVYYVSGNSDLNDEESIINSFFRVASQSLRESAVSFVGEDLRGTEGDIKPEILSRLQALWSKRFGQARVAASMDDYKDELAAFGWWFVSEKFDEKWSVKQLREVLLVIKKVDADDFVVERLAALASKYPRIAVECLSLMIEGDEEGYGVELWKTAAQELLRTALKQDTDHDARTDAFLLINRISARGAIDYAYLLVE